MAVRRDTAAKTAVKWNKIEDVVGILRTMQDDMLARARDQVNAKFHKCTTWADFMKTLDGRGVALIPWCGVTACEKGIKDKTARESKEQEESSAEQAASGAQKLTGAAKSLNIPFDQPPLPAGCKCVGCDGAALQWAIFGRSY